MHWRNLTHSFSMQTRIVHMLFMCLLMLAGLPALARADAPEFPDDPGELYVPPVIIIMGQEVIVTDTTDTTAVIPKEIDVFGDSTVVYDTEENVLNISGATMEVGDSLQAAINYTGSDTLYIILTDSSTIFADTVISTNSNIVISGDGILVAEGTVPIIGTVTATILFDSVSMIVRSLSGPRAVRQRIQGAKRVDENGGPALSGFASADFNKTVVTPPEAEYGEVETQESWGGESGKTNALYVINDAGEKEVLTEFVLTALADEEIDAVENVKTRHSLDINRPMYNILGLPVDATYRGIVVQDGYKYLRQ